MVTTMTGYGKKPVVLVYMAYGAVDIRDLR